MRDPFHEPWDGTAAARGVAGEASRGRRYANPAGRPVAETPSPPARCRLLFGVLADIAANVDCVALVAAQGSPALMALQQQQHGDVARLDVQEDEPHVLLAALLLAGADFARPILLMFRARPRRQLLLGGRDVELLPSTLSTIGQRCRD
jgi:hypothetical protein